MISFTISQYWLSNCLGVTSYATNVDQVAGDGSRPHAPSLCFLCAVYPKKYAHGFVVLCLVVVMQSFIMNSHEVFIHIHQGCFAGTGAIVRLPQCQWSKPAGYGKISQCISATKHSKAKTVCIFLWIYCTLLHYHYFIKSLYQLSAISCYGLVYDLINNKHAMVRTLAMSEQRYSSGYSYWWKA